ncbi:beta-glucuronosyltransferase GlcAT14B-like [Hibiscus syriacus]|nr:beta-glucuronosyltransferase GlcAT14B-like [Hibiscus syriacus]
MNNFIYHEFIKINVDGVCLPQSGSTSIGVIARDFEGLVITGRTLFFFCPRDAGLVETLATCCGFRFAVEHGYSHMIIERNATNIVNQVLNPHTGSAWTIMSRPFIEYIIMGWDNLPRILLMYYTNFISSPEGYFQTVVCNIPEFAKTVINHDMYYIKWDNPPKQHPHVLSLNDLGRMIWSNAAFARKFK